MNNLGSHIIHGLIALVLQILIFRQIQFGDSIVSHSHILFYPIILILLPIKVPRNALLLLAFIIGIILDIFYSSLGVHTSTLVFTAFFRPFILQILEPRGGYNVNTSPTRYHLGLNWFVRYASILMLIHCFFYFSVEAFSFIYIKEILLGTLFSFIFSMIFILLYQFLINPK